jgi:hypothetical protein
MRERVDWKARAERAGRDLTASYVEIDRLEGELRFAKAKLERMHTRLDQHSRLMTLRTSALCTLLGLADPRWQPTKEEMEP